jgi:CSLREA domain-containing protein
MKTLFSRCSILTLSLVMALLLGLLPMHAEGKGSHRAPLTTITVNSNGDQGDADTGDGICDTTGTRSGDPYSGNCTLRAAIETANANGTADTINFSGPMTIQPTTKSYGLPSIEEQTTINGIGVVVIDGVDSSIFAGFSLGGNGNHQIIGLTIKNFKKGIYVSPNAPNNTIQNNVIVSNGTGIYVSSDGNAIKGNKIGTDGTQDLGNSGDGIKIYGANNVIGSSTGLSAGGSCSGDCNLISGNGGDGVDIAQGTDPASGSTNTVRGNFIGTNLAGTAAIPNEGSGIKTNGDNNSFLGNLISGNHGHGIDLTYGADNNVVRGNLIGTKINGTDALGNGGGGVNMDSADGNVIGGDLGTPLPNQCQSPCNLIAANAAGITITQALDGGNMVIGNFIGTDVNGTWDLGNHGNGIWAQGITITLASNLIVHNRGDGVHIYGVGYGNLGNFNHHVVQGNRIGVLADGSDAPNYGYGIYVDNSSGNLIGGDQAGQGNTIAHNIKGGVVIANYGSEANRIWGNSIYANNSSWADKLGIDLNKDGVTLNDADDSDGGPNNLQNFPVITGLQGSQVSGVLTSTANTTFRLEFFANPECTQSGYGEGKTFLGTFDVTTNASGRADFQSTLTTAPGGQLVTATATDPDGNTSEFSACFGGLVVNSVGDASDNNWGDGLSNTGATISNGDPECTLRAAIQEANTMDTAAITFDIPGYGNDVPEIDLLSSALPEIDKPVSINGTTQESGLVRLNGFVNGINGLELWGGQSQVRGLALCYFDGHGILLWSGNNNLIVGNLIGVDENNNPCPIGGKGIRIMDTSDNNVIGGTTEAERNVIANSSLSGIYVMADSSGNTIQGNYIGTDLSGTAAPGQQHCRGAHRRQREPGGRAGGFLGDLHRCLQPDCGQQVRGAPERQQGPHQHHPGQLYWHKPHRHGSPGQHRDGGRGHRRGFR